MVRPDTTEVMLADDILQNVKLVCDAVHANLDTVPDPAATTVEFMRLFQAIEQGSFLPLQTQELFLAWFKHQDPTAKDLNERLYSASKSVSLPIQKAILSYFISYRFLDLSTFSVPSQQNNAVGASSSGVAVANLDLPANHERFIEAVLVDMPNNLSVDDSNDSGKTLDIIRTYVPGGSLISDRFRSAPWLGDYDPVLILKSVAVLLAFGILEFAMDMSIQSSYATSGTPVLRMNPSFRFPAGHDNGNQSYANSIACFGSMEQKRSNLVTDLGTAITAAGGCSTNELIRFAQSGDVIKIATYHFRTLSQGGLNLGKMLSETPGIRVQVLCLGPTSIEALSEGASESTLEAGLQEGVWNYSQWISEVKREIGNRIEIRVYGDVENDSFFRGNILTDTHGNVRIVNAVSWSYGESRANYGEILRLAGNSNLGKLINCYYDRAWANSIPLPVPDRFTPIKWTLEKIPFETVLTASILLVISALVLFFGPDGKFDALFSLVPALITIGSAVYLSRDRLKRAGNVPVRLAKEIQKRLRARQSP